MALATQCPHCHTTFRVAHDQLKLRAGMVRCGACKQVFNGVEHLLRPDDAAPAALEVPSELTPVSAPVTAPEGASDVAPAEPTEPLDFGIFLAPGNFAPAQTDTTPSELAAEPLASGDQASAETLPDHPIDHAPSALPEPREPSAAPDVERNDEQPAVAEPQLVAPSAPPAAAHVAAPAEEEHDPWLRMTLMHFADPETDSPDQRPPADAEPAAATPTRATGDASDAYHDWPKTPSDAPGPSFFSLDADEADLSQAEEPDFVRRGRRRQRAGRVLRMVMAVASIVLLLTLLLQGIVNFRAQIAGFIPALQPVLDQVCANIDCRTRLAAQIDQLSIDANTELQTLTTGSDDFALVLLLRNRSSSNQSWPHIELTLNDANEQTVARRVFTPRDYLPVGQNVATGFAPQSEQPVRILFTLSQLKASAYRVAVFYP